MLDKLLLQVCNNHFRDIIFPPRKRLSKDLKNSEEKCSFTSSNSTENKKIIFISL